MAEKKPSLLDRLRKGVSGGSTAGLLNPKRRADYIDEAVNASVSGKKSETYPEYAKKK